MLSFLNEDKPNDNDSVNELTGEQNADNEDQISNQEDYLIPAQHGKNLKQSTIVLAALFAVGALVVLFMIKKTTPSSADAAQSDAQKQIEAVLGELARVEGNIAKHNKIVGRFYDSADVDQIKVSELKKNPFRSDLGPITQTEDTSRQSNWKREEIEAKVQTLRLLSIMESPQGGCCMIDDKLLNIGDQIKGLTVTKISGKYVYLTSDNITIKLKMTE